MLRYKFSTLSLEMNLVIRYTFNLYYDIYRHKGTQHLLIKIHKLYFQLSQFVQLYLVTLSKIILKLKHHASLLIKLKLLDR